VNNLRPLLLEKVRVVRRRRKKSVIPMRESDGG